MLPPEMVAGLLKEYFSDPDNLESFGTLVASYLERRKILRMDIQYEDGIDIRIWNLDRNNAGYAILAVLNREMNLGLEILDPPYNVT